MPLACLRTFFFSAFLASLLILSGALYLEYGLGVAACPLCETQRLVLSAFSLTCLAGLIFRAGLRTERIFLGTSLFLALSGGLFAARHVWLQGLHPLVEMTCLKSMGYLYEQGTLGEWLHSMLIGSVDCVPINWSFIGLSVPEWSLLAFLGLALAVGFRLGLAKRLNPGPAVGS